METDKVCETYGWFLWHWRKFQSDSLFHVKIKGLVHAEMIDSWDIWSRWWKMRWCWRCRRGSRILVRGAQQSFDPKGGPWAQNLLKIGGFPLNLPENCMILKYSWEQGVAGPPGPPSPPPGSATELVSFTCSEATHCWSTFATCRGSSVISWRTMRWGRWCAHCSSVCATTVCTQTTSTSALNCWATATTSGSCSSRSDSCQQVEVISVMRPLRSRASLGCLEVHDSVHCHPPVLWFPLDCFDGMDLFFPPIQMLTEVSNRTACLMLVYAALAQQDIPQCEICGCPIDQTTHVSPANRWTRRTRTTRCRSCRTSASSPTAPWCAPGLRRRLQGTGLLGAFWKEKLCAVWTWKWVNL